jgi:uncharacterized protein YbjT (DUF2867 family)
MQVLVTGGTGHSGPYIISELIAAGHEVTGLARSDKAAAAVSALGAKVRRGDVSDLEGLKAAAAESDGVIHVAHRQDLLPVRRDRRRGRRGAPDHARVWRCAGGDRKAAGRVGEHWLAHERRLGRAHLGRPVTEEDPALSQRR